MDEPLWKVVGALSDEQLLDEFIVGSVDSQPITRDEQVSREVIHRLFVMLAVAAAPHGGGMRCRPIGNSPPK